MSEPTPKPQCRPLIDWCEADGPVLWWAFPVNEPPYSGTPLDHNWPGYHTHWTPFPIPEDPRPEFPRGFVEKHCPKVAEARDWRDRFRLPPDPADDMEFAECSFTPAGAGLKCEACDLHLTRPYCEHDFDEEWLPRIEEYDRKLREIDEKAPKR
jgi:hypothetical protein